MEMEPPSKIAELNDAFRQSGQGIVITQGIQAMNNVPGLIASVQTFNSFTPDNDPYGEHDFGSIVWEKQKTFWKIDYFDQALEYWCDPLSLECRRVLTVMLASEY
jgi:hypothetical protein